LQEGGPAKGLRVNLCPCFKYFGEILLKGATFFADPKFREDVAGAFDLLHLTPAGFLQGIGWDRPIATPRWPSG